MQLVIKNVVHVGVFQVNDVTHALMDITSQIKNVISENKRWKVSEEIYLGFFSFANFVMFKDFYLF